MKAEELIKKLKKYPKDIEVCIFDWRKNVYHSNDEPCSEGIEPDFEIEIEKGIGSDFVVLSFENDDYDNFGNKIN